MSGTHVSPPRLLLVDDDPTWLALLEDLFGVHEPGWAVDVETDPLDALSRVRRARGRFDCIVSDYQMPGADGLELLAAARRVASSVPFFICTSLNPSVVRARLDAYRPTGVLRKSMLTSSPTPLIDRVRAAIDARPADPPCEGEL